MIDFEEPSGGTRVCHTGGANVPYGRSDRYTAKCDEYGYAYFDIYAFDTTYTSVVHDVPKDCSGENIIPSSGEQVKKFSYKVPCMLYDFCEHPGPSDCDSFYEENGHGVILSEDMKIQEHVDSYLDGVAGEIGDRKHLVLIPAPYWLFKNIWVPSKTETVGMEIVIVEKIENRPHHIIVSLDDKHSRVKIPQGDSDVELPNKVYLKVEDLHWGTEDYYARKIWLHFQPHHYPHDVLKVGFRVAHGIVGIESMHVSMQCYTPSSPPSTSPSALPSASPSSSPSASPSLSPSSMPSSSPSKFCPDSVHMESSASEEEYSLVKIAAAGNNEIMLDVFQYLAPTVEELATYLPGNEESGVGSECYNEKKGTNMDTPYGHVGRYTAVCVKDMAEIDVYVRDSSFSEDADHNPPEGCAISSSDNVKHFRYMVECVENPRCPYPVLEECVDVLARSSDVNVHEIMFDDMVDGNGVEEYIGAIPGSFGHEGDKIDAAVIAGNSPIHVYRSLSVPKNTAQVTVSFMTLEHKDESRPANMTLSGSNFEIPIYHEDRENELLDNGVHIHHVKTMDMKSISDVVIRQFTLLFSSSHNHYPSDVFGILIVIPKGTLGIKDFSVDIQCYAPTAAPTLTPTSVPTSVPTLPPTDVCPYVQDATPPGDNSIDIATDEEEIPVQAVSYNSSAVVVAVEQLWWYDPVCKYAAYYKPYDSTKTIQSEDHMCDEQNEVAHGESFEYTIQCYQGMAQIEIFLYEPMFPKNPTHHHVYGQCSDMKSISESDKIQRFIYEFPCEEMRPICEPEDYDCDDDVTRSIRDWSSTVSSNHYNYTSRTYIPPSSSVSLSVKFTLDVKHDGDLMVSVGKKPTLKMGHFAAIGRDNSFEYTFGDEVPVSVSCTVGSRSATSQCDVTMFVDADMFDDIFYLGFSFKDGHFVVDNVSIYAYCEGCPYVEQMEPSSSITHNPLEPPIYILDYGHTDVTFLVKQEFLDDTLCLLSVLYHKKEHGGIVETCADSSNVEPGEPEVHTAQCVNGKVTVTIFAYDEKLAAGDHIDVPEKCHVIDSDHTHKYVFTLPCSYGPPACKPEEDEPCGSDVTKTAGDWSTYLSHYGTKIVGQTYILPEKTSSITAEFSLTKEALGDLIVMAGKHDFRIGTFAPGDSEDHLSGQFSENVGVVVSCYPSTTHCHVGMTVPSSFFQTPDVFFLAFKTQVGTLTVDVDSVRVRSNCESKCPAEIDWGTTKPPIPHSAVRLIRQTPTTVTVKVAQEWTNSVCRMLVNYTDNYLSTPHCHDYHAVPYGELKDEFTIDCAADGYARGTVHAFDEFFGDVIEGTLAMKCPDPKSFHESGYRLDFAYPCDVYCPTPEPERMPIQIDALGLAQTVKENGKKFIKIPRDIEAGRTVVLPPSLTTLTIKFDLHKSRGPAGTLLLTVGYTRLHLDSFSVGTRDDDSYYMDAYEPNDVFVSISSSSSTKTSFTITISNIEPFSYDRRVNFAIEMKNMDITVSPIYMNGS